MEDPIIINLMRNMSTDCRIDLEAKVHKVFPIGDAYNDYDEPSKCANVTQKENRDSIVYQVFHTRTRNYFIIFCVDLPLLLKRIKLSMPWKRASPRFR